MSNDLFISEINKLKRDLAFKREELQAMYLENKGLNKKIDALEKEIAELKEMMKAMAAMKKEAPCSNLQGNGVDSSEVERPLTITTPAAETKMNPSIKSAIVTPMRSKGADPIRAAMLSGIKDKPQLKKVEGRRSCGGTPALAHTGAVSSHQRRPGSFNASMLAKVLDQKFKHTHASTSEDDSDSSDDSEFGSSAEDSGFESEAEEARETPTEELNYNLHNALIKLAKDEC